MFNTVLTTLYRTIDVFARNDLKYKPRAKSNSPCVASAVWVIRAKFAGHIRTKHTAARPIRRLF